MSLVSSSAVLVQEVLQKVPGLAISDLTVDGLAQLVPLLFAQCVAMLFDFFVQL